LKTKNKSFLTVNIFIEKLMNKLELLLPAGDLEKLKIAFQYGADAVYAGVPSFSLRARENDFKIDSVKEAIEYTHNLGKKIYLTVNIFPHNSKLAPLQRAIKEMAELKPDAFIMADPGVIYLAKEVCPEIPIHLSVQANNINWASVKFWKEQGISRVILSRELSLREVKVIHENVPDIELEFFVHGAICMAYSGRCLLSNYMSFRDANQGTCAHSCRWQYKVYKANDKQEVRNCCEDEVWAKPDEMTDDGVFDPNYKPIEGKYFLEEVERKGEYLETDEDEYGTYIMNSRDLCAIEYLKELEDSGVCSFKVEGRSKSIYYVASVARTYRKAMDEMAQGKNPDFDFVKELAKTANRGFIPGFLVSNPKHHAQHYENSAPINTHEFIGVIREYTEYGFAKMEVRNRIETGEEIEIFYPDFKDDFTQIITEMKNLDNENISVAHGGAGSVLIKLDKETFHGVMVRRKVREN
jgi:putative protease